MNHNKTTSMGSGRPLSNGNYSPRWLEKGTAGSRGVDSPTGNVSTPVKAFLSTNITPRSGSRKARAESASPTSVPVPRSTSTFSRPPSSTEKRESYGDNASSLSGLGIKSPTLLARESRSGSVLSNGSNSAKRPSYLDQTNSSARTASPESSPMFFHANDVQATVPSKDHAIVQPRLSGNGYLNGEVIQRGRTSALSNHSSGTDDQRSQFFYANDPVEAKPTPRLSNGPTGSRPPLQTIYSAQAASTSPQRASSPLKEEVLPRKPSLTKPSPRRHTRLVSNGGSEIKSAELNTDLGRRLSLNMSPDTTASSHARSSSIQSAGYRQTHSRRSSIAYSEGSPVSTQRNRATSITSTSGALPHSVNPPASTQELKLSPPPSLPQSPTKSKSKLDQMNELAANARRERKVLDLEISNSSLLAINRTLEREMRKQNAELRRYRRLSKSGRLSVAPSRSASGKMSILSGTDSNSESRDDSFLHSDDNGEDEGDALSDFSQSSGSRPSSPSARATRARFKDPKPSHLDFAAHRALLLESQKLNQTIKRCLSHSESLITSGKLALEYRVQPPDVENLGPRVLTPDEDDSFAAGQGLLSPGVIGAENTANPWERSLANLDSLEDGLTTPDYSKWGSPTTAPTPFLGPDGMFETESMDKLATKDPSSLAAPTAGDDIASLDGLDDESDTKQPPEPDMKMPPPQTSKPEEAVPTDVPTDQQSSSGEEEDEPASKEEKPNRNSTSVLNNTPGNRSSFQNFGNYLQTLSIFGTGGQGQS